MIFSGEPGYRKKEWKIAVSFFMLLMLAGYTYGQSPYSRYGIGSIYSPVFSANKGMGNIAAPYASNTNINYTNPASYASLTRTTFDIGANVGGVNLGTKDSIYKAASGGLNHFAIAFVPLPKHNNWAISVGLLPYSEVNYNFIQNYGDSIVGAHREAFVGKGSLYQIYIGGAYKVKGFSAGVNVGYIFGKNTYQKIAVFADSTNSYGTRNITNMNVSGVNYSIGLQYEKMIYHDRNAPDPRKEIYMTIGMYGTSGTKMNTRISNYWDRFNYDLLGNVAIADTLESSFNQKGKIKLPFNIGAGIMFGNERFWMLGADFKFSNWKSFTNPLNNVALGNSWQGSIGGQITPKYDARGYFKRVQYRLGGYVGKSEVVFAGNSLNEAGGTVGLGLPFKSVAHLNITGDFGSRGTGNTSAIRETYYRFTFGFVLNDIWFLKRKFD